MTYSEMQILFMKELRLYHYPIAVKFFYDRAAIEDFRKNCNEIESPIKSITFCQ